MFAIDSALLLNGLWKIWYLITLLKSSELGGIRAQVQAIRIIMEKFKDSPDDVQDTPYIL